MSNSPFYKTGVSKSPLLTAGHPGADVSHIHKEGPFTKIKDKRTSKIKQKQKKKYDVDATFKKVSDAAAKANAYNKKQRNLKSTKRMRGGGDKYNSKNSKTNDEKDTAKRGPMGYQID